MNRHQIRAAAFQTLFMLNANSDAELPLAYQQVLQLMAQSDDEQPVPAYLEQLVTGVQAQQAQLDEIITAHLKKGWSLQRLSQTDLIILRIALYEMKNVADVPQKASVNEAIELAKQFSDDKSRRFINGLLSQVLTEEQAASEQ
nr:transcription antitermination factor NusB [Lactobacillus selangorensis]